MEGRPLAQQFGPGSAVLELVRRGSREGIGGDVPNAVTGGLDRVKADLGKLAKNFGHLGQGNPVELEVLPGGEVAVASVKALGNAC